MRQTPEERELTCAALRKEYEGGASVRALSLKMGRSYGWIHRALIDSGATMRKRGGNHRPPRTGPASEAQ